MHERYEAVIGLEVHLQLKTLSKAYSSDPVTYGEGPNTQISPITLGHPGTLPRMNAKTIEFAIRLGLACNCQIRRENQFARKNYFYADLPKGYQITQDKTPICTEGWVDIQLADGLNKRIHLTRIHMEEDAGKSLHDIDPFHTLVDLNRAGTPLLEIVSEPELRNGEEAYAYLNEIRKLARYLDISDGNMEEGSLRCDVNISLRPIGAQAFGTKVEVKNLNSFRNVQKSIDFEFARQAELLDKGERIIQETRNYEAARNITYALRSKEEAHDYRYFPEPDLQPVIVTPERIEQVKAQMPVLPWVRVEKYTHEWGLSAYDASVLTEDREMANYFEAIVNHGAEPKATANLLNTQIRASLNQNAWSLSQYAVKPGQVAELLSLVNQQLISYSIASQRILPLLENGTHLSAEAIARENNWLQNSDSDQLSTWADAVLAEYPEKVAEYQAGKKGLIGLFMGEVMKRSGGKADPKKTQEIIRLKLENHNP